MVYYQTARKGAEWAIVHFVSFNQTTFPKAHFKKWGLPKNYFVHWVLSFKLLRFEFTKNLRVRNILKVVQKLKHRND